MEIYFDIDKIIQMKLSRQEKMRWVERKNLVAQTMEFPFKKENERKRMEIREEISKFTKPSRQKVNELKARIGQLSQINLPRLSQEKLNKQLLKLNKFKDTFSEIDRAKIDAIEYFLDKIDDTPKLVNQIEELKVKLRSRSVKPADEIKANKHLKALSNMKPFSLN